MPPTRFISAVLMFMTANGEKFHFAFLSFFRLYVRLFLNSFGIQASMVPVSKSSVTYRPAHRSTAKTATHRRAGLRLVFKRSRLAIPVRSRICRSSPRSLLLWVSLYVTSYRRQLFSLIFNPHSSATAKTL